MIWIWILIGVMACIVAVVAVLSVWEALGGNKICNYCNADGDPCPWCSGSRL